MKILLDMNLSPRWVAFLQGHGIEAVHWSNVGKENATDAEIMAFAAKHGYVVMTHDLDFGDILATTRGDKPSVVQIRTDDINPKTIGKTVVSSLLQIEDDLESGALATIDPHKTRLRVLPLLHGGQ